MGHVAPKLLEDFAFGDYVIGRRKEIEESGERRALKQGVEEDEDEDAGGRMTTQEGHHRARKVQKRTQAGERGRNPEGELLRADDIKLRTATHTAKLASEWQGTRED